jgi:hypothetical protein
MPKKFLIHCRIVEPRIVEQQYDAITDTPVRYGPTCLRMVTKL